MTMHTLHGLELRRRGRAALHQLDKRILVRAQGFLRTRCLAVDLLLQLVNVDLGQQAFHPMMAQVFLLREHGLVQAFDVLGDALNCVNEIGHYEAEFPIGNVLPSHATRQLEALQS